jgi:hypothetical protein
VPKHPDRLRDTSSEVNHAPLPSQSCDGRLNPVAREIGKRIVDGAARIGEVDFKLPSQCCCRFLTRARQKLPYKPPSKRFIIRRDSGHEQLRRRHPMTRFMGGFE